MSTSQAIITHRQSASLASKGTSSQEIYTVFEQVLTILDLEGDVLDFGAGVGNLSQRLQALGRFKSITAADMMQRPVKIDDSINWFSRDLNDSLDIHQQAFDVIVSAEVIEHLENPRAIVAREWFRLLRPGGTLVFSTPNNESLRSLLALTLQGHFVAFSDTCYPAHITALVRKDIKRILAEAGFCAPNFVFINFGSIPKLPGISWQKYSCGLLKGLRFSDNLVAIAQKSQN